MDRYQVNITPEQVKVESTSSAFSGFSEAIYLRYPKNSFALSCRTTPDDPTGCTDFKETLLSAIPDLAEFTFGPGKIPYPVKLSSNELEPPPTFYRYEKEEDFEHAGELVVNFTRLSTTPRVTLVNWKDNRFSSQSSD